MTPAPHRLVLGAGELAYLVERTGAELPPAWMPSADIGPAEAGLIKKRVIEGRAWPGVRVSRREVRAESDDEVSRR